MYVLVWETLDYVGVSTHNCQPQYLLHFQHDPLIRPIKYVILQNQYAKFIRAMADDRWGPEGRYYTENYAVYEQNDNTATH